MMKNFSKVWNFGKVTTYPSAVGTTDFVSPEFIPGFPGFSQESMPLSLLCTQNNFRDLSPPNQQLTSPSKKILKNLLKKW
jgi:hypothetical protein